MTKLKKAKPRLGALTLLPAALAAGCAGLASQAHAQAGSSQVEEVVVTAGRRAENQQRVPVAVTAVTGQAAERLGTADALGLAQLVPNVTFNRSTQATIPFIRGVGVSSAAMSNEPSVALYIDDVYRPVSNISGYNSIERLEVIKGPQGTLFGRNATGGVIQVFTKNPTPEPAMDVSVGYGSYQTVTGSLYATSRITDTVSANIALYGSKQHDGWGTDFTTGQPTYREQKYGGRLKIRWAPTDATTVLLALDRDVTKTGQGLVFNAMPGTLVAGGFAGAPGWYDTLANINGFTENYQVGASLKATQDFGWAKLVSISAYRYNEAPEYYDLDAGPVANPNVRMRPKDMAYTQEFQLLSPESSSVSWLVGLYFMDDRANQPLTFTGTAPPYSTLGVIASLGTVRTESYAAFAQGTATILPKTRLTLGIRYTEDHRSLDLYNISGQNPAVSRSRPFDMQKAKFPKLTWRIALDYQLNDDVMLYAAYNRGFKSGVFNIVAVLTPPDPATRPEIVDAYTVGFKSELFDRRLRFNAEGFYYQYDNIQLQSVVVNAGVATNRLVNAGAATVYGVDFDVTLVPMENMTITGGLGLMSAKFDSYVNGSYFVYNGAAGGNCSFTFLPTGTNACNTRAAQLGVLPPNYNPATGYWDLKGNHLANSPPISVTLAVNYKIPTQNGTFDLNALWNHGGNSYFSADNGKGQVAPSKPENIKQRPYDLFDASIGWQSLDESWAIRLWGKNLTGEKRIAYSTGTTSATFYSAAPPRTYGVTLTKHLK